MYLAVLYIVNYKKAEYRESTKKLFEQIHTMIELQS